MELLKLCDGRCSLLPITLQKLDQRSERSNPLVSRVGTPFQKMTCCLLTWPRCWSFGIPFRQMQKTTACSTYYRIQLACCLQRSRVKRFFGYVCRKGIPSKVRIAAVGRASRNMFSSCLMILEFPDCLLVL